MAGVTPQPRAWGRVLTL